MGDIGTILGLLNSGLIGVITADAPHLKADADKLAADLALIAKDAQKFLADAKPIIDALSAKGTQS